MLCSSCASGWFPQTPQARIVVLFKPSAVPRCHTLLSSLASYCSPCLLPMMVEDEAVDALVKHLLRTKHTTTGEARRWGGNRSRKEAEKRRSRARKGCRRTPGQGSCTYQCEGGGRGLLAV
eukprot:767738-Hanusia_phi.AAC.3